MKSFFVENINDLKIVLNKLSKNNNTLSVLMFIADGDRIENELINEVLRNFDKPIIGGIFPEIIFESNRLKSGIMLYSLPFVLESNIIDLNESEEKVNESILNCKKRKEFKNLFLFIDCFSEKKSFFIESIYNFYGNEIKYFGGGCGSLTFDKIPCVFNNNGLQHNAVVIAFNDIEMELGVAHGWGAISNNLKVTEALGNEIISINWEPAFEVYSRIVEAHSQKSFNDYSFFDLAKSYPLGILKIEGEMVVRDPIIRDGNKLILVDKVEQGENIKILNGDKKSLQEAAYSVKNQILFSENFENFCIDCISRVLFLEEDFQNEINILSGQKKLNGILTIGEIANNGESYLEIYNKTIVLASWKK
ncbi:MAG: FIST signal transduction protein [Flavobacterium sp.]